MLCTDVQVNCRSGRRLLPDYEVDLRAILDAPERLINLTSSSEVANLEADFTEKGAAFIRVTDEISGTTYYVDNGSGNEHPVELMTGSDCPAGKLMCYDKGDVADIIAHFSKTGERNPNYAWITVG